MSQASLQAIDRAIDDARERLVAARRHLHMHPEPSGAELETTEYLAARLVELGLAGRRGPGGRGLIVDRPGTENSHEPRFALRADIDALRIEEQNDVAYRSCRPGLMHACGHDAHATCLLGALVGLQAADAAGVLPAEVRWRAIFQPAEETAEGATEMIGAGALQDVAAIVALHMDPSKPVGRVGVRVGPLTASCDDVDIRIEGRGGHAARPHESLDPVTVAATLIATLNAQLPRAVDAQEPIVLTFGRISGGQNRNVIPEAVELAGTLRTLHRTARARAKEQIAQLCAGVALATGTRIDVRFHSGTAGVENDAAVTELLRRAAAEVVGVEGVYDLPRPSMGAEDFAQYLDVVPGSMLRLGCSRTNEPSPGLHNPQFDIDERALAVGAKILARAVIFYSSAAMSSIANSSST